MSKFDGKAFGEHVLAEVTRAMRASIDPLKERITRLEAELAETKAKRIPYCGPWREGIPSHKNHFYTFGGSVWHCNADTISKPNESHTEWVLAVKHGRDGKDAR